MKPLRRVRPAEVVDSLGGVASRDELLACVSALAWYDGEPVEEPIHVLVRRGASRLGPGAVVHWTRRELGGSRLMVDEKVASMQAATCRAALSR